MSEQVPLKALKAFESVARLDSFSRAAGELHVTQSAISHQVAALEDWTGRPLFDRSGRKPKLLPHGAMLAVSLSAAFAEITNACRLARQDIRENDLTIAVIPSIATCWLIPRLSAFRKENPDVNLRIMYVIHSQPLEFANSDIAIIYAHEPPKFVGAAATHLLSGASAPVCSRAFLDAHAPLDRPERIVSAGLLHDTDRSGWQQWLNVASDQPAAPPDGPVYGDFNLLRAAALAGQGTALCPLSVIADDIEDGRLVKLSDLTVHDDSAYYLMEKGWNCQFGRIDIPQLANRAGRIGQSGRSGSEQSAITGLSRGHTGQSQHVPGERQIAGENRFTDASFRFGCYLSNTQICAGNEHRIAVGHRIDLLYCVQDRLRRDARNHPVIPLLERAKSGNLQAVFFKQGSHRCRNARYIGRHESQSGDAVGAARFDNCGYRICNHRLRTYFSHRRSDIVRSDYCRTRSAAIADNIIGDVREQRGRVRDFSFHCRKRTGIDVGRHDNTGVIEGNTLSRNEACKLIFYRLVGLKDDQAQITKGSKTAISIERQAIGFNQSRVNRALRVCSVAAARRHE